MGGAAFDLQAAARRLAVARDTGVPVPHLQVLPPDSEAAYRVQDLLVAAPVAVGGWKVGAKGPLHEPGCGPLPASGLFTSGAALADGRWRMRGIEVEVALRLGRDLPAPDGEPDLQTLQAAVAAIVPAIEVIETRLADWRESHPLAQQADWQNHGGLVVGADSAMAPSALDLRTVRAYLAFDGQPVASTLGANPAGDVWRLLAWLAVHCARRGMPLRAGQVVTTGSCTGMLFAPEGALVQAQLQGIGAVELRF